MFLLIGLALPPPGTAGDQTPPDQSPDINERGVGDVLRPPPPPPADLIGQRTSAYLSCPQAPGLPRWTMIGVRNQGTGPARGFFTEVTSFNRRIRLRSDGLAPGVQFPYMVQIACPPQVPCPVTVTVDVDGEVTESNETNNVFSFTCP
jgi:hypothetical protein